MATSGAFPLATSGDFFMATDRGRDDWNPFDPKYLDTAGAPSRPSIKRIAPPT